MLGFFLGFLTRLQNRFSSWSKDLHKIVPTRRGDDDSTKVPLGDVTRLGRFCVSPWNNWSIRQQLLLTTLLPVTYLFCMLVWHSYWLHSHEVTAEVEERGKIVAKVLAESSEYALATGKLSELRLSLDGLVESERGIVSIDILDAKKKILLHSQLNSQPNSQLSSTLNSQPVDNNQTELRTFDVPIEKRLLWVNVISGIDNALLKNNQNSPNNSDHSGASAQLAGYVHVVMSPSDLQRKQQHRFGLELAVAALGLLVSALLAVHLSRTLSTSFKSFIEACRDIRRGRYPVDLEVKNGGEIGELQASIKEMATSLQQSTYELESKVTQRTHELENSRNEALKANAEKRKLIQKVHTIVEEERKSIALEVHDELNAALIAARLQSQRIADLVTQIPATVQTDEIRQHALSINQIARTLYNNGRSLVRRLRPEVLDMLGLEGAVTEMVNSYDSTHTTCTFSCTTKGDFSHLDNATAMSAYRIIQEALSNIIKHADASEAHVLLQLNAQENKVYLQISDDGKGFSEDEVTAGIGLVGMRERVFALEGEIQIKSTASTRLIATSEKNTGTIISIWFAAVSKKPIP
ncbi:two-component system sensor histidine kinase UhpB [Undibacterium sp. GrIS 1.2]|uniref:ATP-binding protein n=1 Tax=Undibacterium sp. GrIS 1.2 TaxID=3143933 RepID=UPI00339A8960